TTAFDQTSAGTGAWQTLTAISTPSSALDSRKLQFVASGGAAEFYVDSVSIVEANPKLASIVQERGIQGANPALLQSTFQFQPGGNNLTTETMAGKTTSHRFANGVYVGSANPANQMTAQSIGDDYRPAAVMDANGHQTTLAWGVNGKVLNG